MYDYVGGEAALPLCKNEKYGCAFVNSIFS